MPRFSHLTIGAIVLCVASAVAAGCSGLASGAMPNSVATGSGLTSTLLPLKAGVAIREFRDLPRYGDYYAPSAITSAAGSLWVADTIDQDYGENVIVQIATSGKRTNAFYYSGPESQGASFQDIAYGSDRALWITDFYNGQIVKMTLQGAFTNFPLEGFTSPFGIVSGPDKALWFTAYGGSGSVIGRLTTEGKFTFYPTTIFGLPLHRTTRLVE
jgi:streptogramin lyase